MCVDSIVGYSSCIWLNYSIWSQPWWSTDTAKMMSFRLCAIRRDWESCWLHCLHSLFSDVAKSQRHWFEVRGRIWYGSSRPGTTGWHWLRMDSECMITSTRVWLKDHFKGSCSILELVHRICWFQPSITVTDSRHVLESTCEWRS
jgi:hypothetical protein